MTAPCRGGSGSCGPAAAAAPAALITTVATAFSVLCLRHCSASSFCGSRLPSLLENYQLLSLQILFHHQPKGRGHWRLQAGAQLSEDGAGTDVRLCDLLGGQFKMSTLTSQRPTHTRARPPRCLLEMSTWLPQPVRDHTCAFATAPLSEDVPHPPSENPRIALDSALSPPPPALYIQSIGWC